MNWLNLSSEMPNMLAIVKLHYVLGINLTQFLLRGRHFAILYFLYFPACPVLQGMCLLGYDRQPAGTRIFLWMHVNKSV
jgi:hypothetical protein